MEWLYLAAAILVEVASTLALRVAAAGQVLLAPLDFMVREQYLHARSTLNRRATDGNAPWAYRSYSGPNVARSHASSVRIAAHNVAPRYTAIRMATAQCAEATARPAPNNDDPRYSGCRVKRYGPDDVTSRQREPSQNRRTGQVQ